jgi:hypothetical protein
VVATDLNRDGWLDILVMRAPPPRAASRRSPSPPSGGEGEGAADDCVRLTLIPGYGDRFGPPIELPPAFGQPLVFNLDAQPASGALARLARPAPRAQVASPLLPAVPMGAAKAGTARARRAEPTSR